MHRKSGLSWLERNCVRANERARGSERTNMSEGNGTLEEAILCDE
jgi:hypothetical protein